MALGGLSVYSKDGGWGVSSVVSGIVKGWTSAIDGWLSSGNIDGVGQNSWKLLPVDVEGNQTQGAGIALGRCDRVANGTAYPKILTSLELRFDWLGQSHTRCHTRSQWVAAGAQGRRGFGARRRRCERRQRERRTLPPRRRTLLRGSWWSGLRRGG